MASTARTWLPTATSFGVHVIMTNMNLSYYVRQKWARNLLGQRPSGVKLRNGCSGHRAPQAVREGAALVADLFLRADVLVRVGVGRLVDGLLEGRQRNRLPGLGLALEHDPDPLGDLLH